MRVLIACECSGRVREAFKLRGHDAWSCDILPSEIPGQHIQDDVLKMLEVENGWDLMIAHPPCTYLTVAGNRWFKPEYGLIYPDRAEQREEAINFFMLLANAPIEKIAIENPICIMSTHWRKPDQIIQPWQFGDRALKKTALWLKNLPRLTPTKIVEPEFKIYNSKSNKSGKSKYPLLWSGKRDAAARSRTFQGIANAMAEQWG